jgi:predicted negative regulator of RcsB-dependent stress response
MAEKLTRKELRGPDAFQKAGLQARQWLEDNKRLVKLVVGVILLGGAGIAVASYVSNRGETEASRALASALKVLDRPTGTSGEPAADEDAEPPFASQAEKDAALIKELASVREKYPRTRAAVVAELPVAEAELRLGRPDEALKSFEDFLKASSADPHLRAQALEGEGYAYEAKGQLDQALSSFDELARSKSDFLGAMGLYHRGRILAEQGKKQEAADAFAQTSSSFPNSPASRLASDRLAVLADQGIKPTPPPAPSLNPDAG